MADQAGTTLRGYGHCPEYSEIFPLDRFDLGRSIPSRPRTAAEQVWPRWLGHDLLEAPDSGIGRTKDGKTCSGSVGWFDQSTFQPTIPQPIRRKRRAGGRVVTVSDAGLDVRSEGPGLRRWTWLTWWHVYRRKWRSSGQSPDMVAPEGRRFPSGWSGYTSTPVPMYVFEWVGRCHGGSTACVSPRRERPQHGPAGAGTPAGVIRSFV